ncbi:MAG: PaaI family thioesterase [Proteobacteria bacterium]|nr:PaaI family thioesterase [Pseudomonadota bacterium]HQR04377.1 PaaI family thioesterase [Rhodocyclaceae bacterium]
MQLTPEQTAYHRIADAMRETLLRLQRVNVDTAGLAALTATLQLLNRQLEEHGAEERMLPRFQFEDLSGGIEWLLPYGPMTGPCNPLAPKLHFRRDSERLLAEVVVTSIHEGPPGMVHGGVLSGIYDQLLAFACILNGPAGPTASLSVDFRRPSPLGVPLHFAAWIGKTEGRKVHVEGECRDPEGQLLTTARALFIGTHPGMKAPDALPRP